MLPVSASVFGIEVVVSEYMPPDMMLLIGHSIVIPRGIVPDMDPPLSTYDGWLLIYRAGGR